MNDKRRCLFFGSLISQLKSPNRNTDVLMFSVNALRYFSRKLLIWAIDLEGLMYIDITETIDAPVMISVKAMSP